MITYNYTQALTEDIIHTVSYNSDNIKMGRDENMFHEDPEWSSVSGQKGSYRK